MKRLISISTVLTIAILLSAHGNDDRLRGPWRPIIYHIYGVDIPMEGLVIFTQKHFSSNVQFELTKGLIKDGNYNAGQYETQGDKIIFRQCIQIHLRPGDKEDPIQLPHQPLEEATYKVEENRLLIIFPSKNRFILEKIRE